MKKIIFLAFVLVISTLLTTSCSSDEGAGTPSNPTDPTPQAKLPVVGTATISNTTFTQTTYSVPMIVYKGIDARSITLLVDTTYVAPADIANYTPHFNNADRVLDTNYGNTTLTSGEDTEKTFNITCTITGNPGDNWRVYLSYITSTSLELRYSTVSSVALGGFKKGNLVENETALIWKTWNGGHNATILYVNELVGSNQLSPPFDFKGFFAGTSTAVGAGLNNTLKLKDVEASQTTSFAPNGAAKTCYNVNPQYFIPSLGDYQEAANHLKYIFRNEALYNQVLNGKALLTSSEVDADKVYTFKFPFWNLAQSANPVPTQVLQTTKYIQSASGPNNPNFRVFMMKNIAWPS